MSLYPCKCGCGELVERTSAKRRWYFSNACRQKHYRSKKGKKMTPIESLRRCTNCGVQFSAKNIKQHFHSTSCRSSYHQQQKRLNLKDLQRAS
jgi:hypothetical protein